MGSLETSKVRTLNELMKSMKDNAEKEFPPGKIGTCLEVATRCHKILPLLQYGLNFSFWEISHGLTAFSYNLHRLSSRLTTIAESPNMNRLEFAAKYKLSDEEFHKALHDMRDWGRRKAVDQCLEKYGVDVILGPGDSRINELSSTAGKQSQ